MKKINFNVESTIIKLVLSVRRLFLDKLRVVSVNVFLLFFSMSSPVFANDVLPPVLESIGVSPSEVDVSGGAAVINFVIDAEDESNISRGSGSFVVVEQPNGVNVFANSWTGEGPYRSSITIPEGGLSGFYKIDQVFITDEFGNRKVYRRDELDELGIPDGFGVVSSEDQGVDVSIESTSQQPQASIGVPFDASFVLSSSEGEIVDTLVSGSISGASLGAVALSNVSGGQTASVCEIASREAESSFECTLSSSSSADVLLTMTPGGLEDIIIVLDVLGPRVDPNIGNNSLSERISVSGASTICSDVSAGATRLLAGQFLELTIHGTCLFSPAGDSLTIPTIATAASLNVTAVTPDAAGFVTVWPCGVARPNASNLNFVAGDVVPNGVVAPIGSNGSVCLYSSQATDLIVDVAGWFEGEAFVGATPQRLVDTRDGTGGQLGQLVAEAPLVVQATGISATTAAGSATTVPTTAGTVALNVTVVSPDSPGFITVYPCDAPRPLASNLNYVAGQVVANGVLAPVSSSGQVCLYSQSPTDIIVDLAGWFPGDAFTGATPNRLVDTRDGTGAPLAKLQPSGQLSVAVQGSILSVNGNSAQVPLDASAVALNVTVVNPESGGFVTVWPCSATRPNASNLNFTAGKVVANNVVAPIGDQGNVCFFASQNTDIIVDISGYFTGASGNQFVGSTSKRFVDTRDGTGPAPQ